MPFVKRKYEIRAGNELKRKWSYEAVLIDREERLIFITDLSLGEAKSQGELGARWTCTNERSSWEIQLIGEGKKEFIRDLLGRFPRENLRDLRLFKGSTT